MKPERKVLLTDLFVGANQLFLASILYGSGASLWSVPAALVVLPPVTATMYWADRLEPPVPAYTLAAVVTAGIGGPLLPVLFGRIWLESAFPTWLAFGLFAGVGVGYVGYRLVYGLINPIPEPRVARA